MERGLWGFIQGTEVQPESTAQAAVIEAFRLCLDKAYG